MNSDDDYAWNRYFFIRKWAPELVVSGKDLVRAIELAGELYHALHKEQPK